MLWPFSRSLSLSVGGSRIMSIVSGPAGTELSPHWEPSPGLRKEVIQYNLTFQVPLNYIKQRVALVKPASPDVPREWPNWNGSCISRKIGNYNSFIQQTYNSSSHTSKVWGDAREKCLEVFVLKVLPSQSTLLQTRDGLGTHVVLTFTAFHLLPHRHVKAHGSSNRAQCFSVHMSREEDREEP